MAMLVAIFHSPSFFNIAFYRFMSKLNDTGASLYQALIQCCNKTGQG